MQIEVAIRPVAELAPYSRNARRHSPASVSRLAAIIEEMGWTNPILVDEDGIVAGHKRRLAALAIYERGGTIRLPSGRELPAGTVPVLDVTGWTEAQRRAYMLADNQTTLESEWDADVLRLELAWLDGAGIDMGLTGFDAGAIEAALNAADAKADEFAQDEDAAEDDGADPSRGSLLSRIDVTIAEPRHKVASGDHYLLDGKHHLLVTGVMRGWQAWGHLLKDDAIFCPYPGPFTPFGGVPEKHPLVMVQPDKYIAGHILDRFEDVHGMGCVVKVQHD